MKKTTDRGPGGPEGTGGPGQKPPDASQSALRRARAAEALRKNLRRRKAQARGRNAEPDPPA